MNKLKLDEAILQHRNTIDQPVIVVVGNPLDPKIEQHDFVAKGVSVAKHLEAYDLVTVPRLILYNTEPLLEADWDSTTLEAGDVLALVAEPGFIFAATIAMLVITALVTAYSLYTILTLDQPDPGESGKSSRYSVGYSGNRPRPGQPMPVVYGTFRMFPDLSGQFSIYNNNEKILYQLFDVTLGTCDEITADDIYFEDTPLTSFGDYELQHLQPYEVSTLYPNSVLDKGTVDNIELVTADVFMGPHTVNDSSTPITFIVVTVVSPSGSYAIDKKGRYDNYPSWYKVQYRADGGNWVTHEEIIASTNGVQYNQTTTYRVEAGPFY
jgi:hypothetical protein